jgi:hypothetical protein
MPVIPFSDLPKELRVAAYRNAMRKVKQLMVKEGIVRTEDEVAVRELIIGDEANAADFVDLNVRTAVVSGQEFWGQDSANIAANQFSSVIATGEKVPDNKVVVFYGFTDLTPNPDLVAIKFVRGSDTLDIWEVEHCYKSTEEVGGLAFTTDVAGNLVPYCVAYVQNDPIDIQMIFKSASDKNVVLLALIGERYGEHISKS